MRHRTLPILVAAVATFNPALAAVIGISNTQALGFGSFVAGAGGSVTIDTSGARSATGSILLVPSSAGGAAQFNVTGDPSLTYSVGLPADGSATLSNETGHSMPLRNFASTPSGFGQLSAGGSQTLSVGATLDVGADQPTGSYTGTFSVTVDYN